MCISPPKAITKNQTIVIGPKNAATFAVPRDCIKNKPNRMTTAIGTTNFSKPGATSFNPSTAESTEMAGVMMASP